jgi:hypothetical protein
VSEHLKRSIDLAEKITAFAEGAVANLDRTIAAWPAEFRCIMWEAVAEVAKSRAADAKGSLSAAKGET